MFPGKFCNLNFWSGPNNRNEWWEHGIKNQSRSPGNNLFQIETLRHLFLSFVPFRCTLLSRISCFFPNLLICSYYRHSFSLRFCSNSVSYFFPIPPSSRSFLALPWYLTSEYTFLYSLCKFTPHWIMPTFRNVIMLTKSIHCNLMQATEMVDEVRGAMTDCRGCSLLVVAAATPRHLLLL